MKDSWFREMAEFESTYESISVGGTTHKTGISLWIDDKREKPPEFDVWVKTAREALEEISRRGENKEEEPYSLISFDHDLGHYPTDGQREENGSWLLDNLEGLVLSGQVPTFSWRIHSSNPVGRDYMRRVLERICPRKECRE